MLQQWRSCFDNIRRKATALLSNEQRRRDSNITQDMIHANSPKANKSNVSLILIFAAYIKKASLSILLIQIIKPISERERREPFNLGICPFQIFILFNENPKRSMRSQKA